jgi:hypothetical protein
MRGIFRRSHLWLFLVVMFTLSVRGQSYQPSALSIQEIASPAGAASGGANLYTGADGRIYLTWLEKKGERAQALRFAVRDKNSWSEPQTIIEAENLLVNWADFPSMIALKDGSLAAQWLVKSSPEGHASDVFIARSTDRGKTWGKPITPHRDGTKTEHGFVSMLAGAGGQAFMVWLDGRNFAGVSHEGHGASAKEMTLRYASIDAKGQVPQETVLDPRVCECCQTSAAMTAEGPIVVYRDRSDKEVRDISFVRFIKGSWTQPRVLYADAWEINGCPVNGPAVSAEGRKVAVAWFTAANDAPKVKVSFSSDAGQTFGQPVQVNEGTPLGRVDVEVLGDGSAFVTWLERTTSGGEIKVRRVRPDGSRDEAKAVAVSSAARTSGFPRMARFGNEVVVAWTQAGDPARVKTAIIKYLVGK